MWGSACLLNYQKSYLFYYLFIQILEKGGRRNHMSNAKATTKASNPEPPIPSQDCGWLSVYDEEEIFPRCFHGNPQRNRRCPAALSILWAPTGTKPPENCIPSLQSTPLTFACVFSSVPFVVVLSGPSSSESPLP